MRQFCTRGWKRRCWGQLPGGTLHCPCPYAFLPRPSVKADRMAVPGMAEEWLSCEPEGGAAPRGQAEPPSQSWVAFLCMFIYVTEGSFRAVSASAPVGPCFSWLNPLLSEVAGFLASGPARPVTAATGWRGAGSLWGPWGLGTGDQKAEQGLRPSRGHSQLGFPAPVRSGVLASRV